jgi:hypothetical protein
LYIFINNFKNGLITLIGFATVEHVLPPKNAMSLMGFDPETSHIVSHLETVVGS